MDFKRILCCLVAWLLTVFYVQANTSVTVFINNQSYEYPEPVRLNKVLYPMAEGQDWYWPATAVYDLNDPLAEQLKKSVLDAILVELSSHDPDDKHYVLLDSLYRQVSAWSVATRKLIPVSYNLARLYPQKNPMFQPGKYQLRLFQRPSVVHVAGAVKQPGAYEHKADTEMSTFASAISLLPKSDNSVVWVISPSGEIHKKGKAYWNADFSQLMPGSQLYFPAGEGMLNEGLFSAPLTHINEQIVRLAVHRILP